MKKLLILFISVICFESCSKEKSKLKNDEKQIHQEAQIIKNEDSIKISNKEDIQKYYAEFQHELERKTLDSTFFEYECDGREGNVTFYSKNSKLMIIKHNYAEYSHFSAVEKYYLNNDRPFFVFKDETVWNFDGGTPEKPETKDDITESRIYLIDNKSIECLAKKYSIRSVEKIKPDVSKIPNQKSDDCKTDELLSEFEKLIKHKDDKRVLKQCL